MASPLDHTLPKIGDVTQKLHCSFFGMRYGHLSVIANIKSVYMLILFLPKNNISINVDVSYKYGKEEKARCGQDF